MNFIVSLIKYLTSFIELLLVLRFILEILAASTKAIIVVILYGITDALAFPFKGIFPNIIIKDGGIFNLSIFSAIVGYLILMFVAIKLIHLFFKD